MDGGSIQVFEEIKPKINKVEEEPKINKLEGEPEIGDIVFTSFDNIYGMHYDCAAKQFCCWYPQSELGSFLSNKVTLLKYEGNGIFTEMYTGQKILYAPSCTRLGEEIVGNKFDVRYDKTTLFSKLSIKGNILDNYINLKEYPILMKDFFVINEQAYQKIGKQEKDKEEIKRTFDDVIQSLSFELESSIAGIYDEKMNEVYGENIAYNFKHNINPPMYVLAKKDNKEIN